MLRSFVVAIGLTCFKDDGLVVVGTTTADTTLMLTILVILLFSNSNNNKNSSKNSSLVQKLYTIATLDMKYQRKAEKYK